MCVSGVSQPVGFPDVKIDPFLKGVDRLLVWSIEAVRMGPWIYECNEQGRKFTDDPSVLSILMYLELSFVVMAVKSHAALTAVNSKSHDLSSRRSSSIDVQAWNLEITPSEPSQFSYLNLLPPPWPPVGKTTADHSSGVSDAIGTLSPLSHNPNFNWSTSARSKSHCSPAKMIPNSLTFNSYHHGRVDRPMPSRSENWRDIRHVQA